MPVDLPMTFLRQDIAEALAADKADDEEAERLERADIARLAAEAEHAAVTAAEEAAAEFAAMEPPAGSDAGDLPPMRRRLLDYVAWVADLEAQHAALVAGRTAYLTAQKVPTLTKAAIDQLIKEDKSGLVSLMTEGGKAVSQHALRSRERAMLAEKLRHDQHQAETATAALVEVEAKTDQLAKQIEIVKGRRAEFIADVIQEHLMATAGADQVAQVDALRATEMTVLGGFFALQSLRGLVSDPRHQRIALPSIRMAGEQWVTATSDRDGHHVGGLVSGHSVDLPVHEQIAERRRWLAKAEALIAVDTLIERYAPGFGIPGLLRALSADCPTRASTNAYDLCGLHCPDLPGLFGAKVGR